MRYSAVGVFALAVAGISALLLSIGTSPARADSQYDTWFQTDSAQSRYASLLDGQNSAMWGAEQSELTTGSDIAAQAAEYLATFAADAGVEEGIGTALAGATLAVPPTAVTVAATALVVAGGVYFFKKFFGNVGSSSDTATNVETFVWQYSNPCGGSNWTPSPPSGPCWNLRTTSYTYWCVPGSPSGCYSVRPSYLSTDGEAAATSADFPVTRATSDAKLYPYTVERYWTTDLGSAFAAQTGWQNNGGSSTCAGTVAACLTYPPLAVPTTGTPAMTAEVESSPDAVKYWIYHTIIHYDPQPNDPADPGDPVTDPNWTSPDGNGCQLKTHWPHVSYPLNSVDVKASAQCTYAPETVPVTVTLYRCDQQPQPVEASLADGMWGCDPAATNTEDVEVDLPLKWFGQVQAPPIGGTIVPPDGKWFIGVAESPLAAPAFSAIRQLY